MRKFAALVVLAALRLSCQSRFRAATTAQILTGRMPSPRPAAPGAWRQLRRPTRAATDTNASTVAGSTKQVPRNRINQTDWFPEDHGVMPSIVATGRAGDPNAAQCSLCHYPNGKARPENASVSGLPVSYFMQQLEDFRHDCARALSRARRTRPVWP